MDASGNRNLPSVGERNATTENARRILGESPSRLGRSRDIEGLRCAPLGASSMSVAGPLSSPFERAVALQELLVDFATGERGDDTKFATLRREVLDHASSRNLTPDFVRSCRTLPTFWSWIKEQAPTYERRRVIIRKAFQPLLDALERRDGAPSDSAISEALESFDGEGVHRAWVKSLDRRSSDPEGAITMSRTLLETVCKRILDASNTPYSDNDDLPKLYHAVAELLTLAPNQHTQPIFKAISPVSGL